MPDNLDQTWDDLYETPTVDPEIKEPDPPETPPEPAPVVEVKDEDIKPVAGSPEELEAIGQQGKASLDEDDKIIDPSIKDATGIDDKSETGSEKKEDVDMSGIELYLAKYDIEGGMISFEDGSSQHFDELTPEKQQEILSQLHGSQASTVEAKYGLDENEIGLINYLRTNKLTVEQMIESMAEDRVNVLTAMKEVETRNFKDMSDEGVYLQFLKKSNPEATPEEIENDLEKAKQQTNFGKVAASLRSQFETEQSGKVKSKLAEEEDSQARLIEDQRKEVVDAVVGINDIGGIGVDNTMKNNILDKVLEVNEYGDSKFMEEAFSDPSRLFTAAFWYYYGNDMLQQRDNYWKQEKSKAYKRGRQEALGDDPTKISFTSQGSERGKPSKPGAQVLDDDDWLTLHQ